MVDFLTLLVSSQIYPPEDDFIVNIWCNNVVQKFLGIIKPAPFFEGIKKEKKRYQYFLFPLTTEVGVSLNHYCWYYQKYALHIPFPIPQISKTLVSNFTH